MKTLAAKHARPVLILIVALGAGLRFFQLGAHSLWGDELDTLRVLDLGDPMKIVTELFHYRTLTFVYPPLYFLLTLGVTELGRNEACLRLLSALSGTLSICWFHPLARVFMPKREALAATLLFALSPVCLYYSQENRPYALFLMETLLTALGLFRYLKYGGRLYLATFLAGSILGLYTSYVMPVFEFCLFISGLLYATSRRSEGGRGRRDARRRRILAVLAMAVLAAALYLPWTPASAEFLRRNALAEKSPFAFRDAALLYSQLLALPASMSFLPWLLLATSATLLALRRKRDCLALLGPVLITPLLVLMVSRPLHYHYRHSIFVQPFLLLTLFMGASELRLKLRTSFPAATRAVAPAALALVVAFYATWIAKYYQREKEDWRSAVEYIHARAQTGDAIITGLFFVEDAFRYYKMKWPPGVGIYPNRLTDASFVGAMRERRRVWYVTAFRDRLPSWMNDLLEQRFRLIAVFPGESPIYLYFFEWNSSPRENGV